MAEKSSIKDTNKEIDRWQESGVFLELQCCMCMHEQTIAAAKIAELRKKVVEEGWRHLNSDTYMCTGWWCGCDYKGDV